MLVAEPRGTENTPCDGTDTVQSRYLRPRNRSFKGVRNVGLDAGIEPRRTRKVPSRRQRHRLPRELARTRLTEHRSPAEWRVTLRGPPSPASHYRYFRGLVGY